MGSVELLRFNEPSALAEAAAGRWLDAIEAANQRGAALHVALSGGRIAAPFFDAVVRLGRSRNTRWTQVHFFWADERCVPPDDPESNFRLAHDRLLQPLGIAAHQIHRIRGEAPPTRAAAAADSELARLVSERERGWPVLDLVLLGMGEDGHVASLFPDAVEATQNTATSYRAVVATKPPPQRVTLDYGPLAVARQVWVLVSGPGKAEALRASLSPRGRTPLARVIQSRPNTVVFTDVSGV